MNTNNPKRCALYERMNLERYEAWIHKDFIRAGELTRQMQDHYDNCSICNPMSGADHLWPGKKVTCE